MRDRINDTVEELDEIGHSIYLAELAGWNELVSLVGMPSTFASAIDIVSIIAGIAMFVYLNGMVATAGGIIALAGVVGLLRRVLA